MTHGVIFDMDGVLVNSYDAHFHSWKSTGQKYGLELTEENFRKTFGRTSREIIKALWGDRFSDEEIKKFDEQKEAAYRDILAKHFPEMPGASELIEKLHAAGFKLAIGSSGPPENVSLVQRQLRAGKLISATVTGMEVKHGKPEPEVFLKAAAKINVDPKNCAVIEDAAVGIEAAKRAGMLAVGLTGTTTRQVLEARGADVVVDSLNELTPQMLTRN